MSEFLRTDALLTTIEHPSRFEEAEALLYRALHSSRQHGSRLNELLAATDIARPLGKQGRNQEGYDLLSSLYDGFTEGHDTKPLVEARQLLEALRAAN